MGVPWGEAAAGRRVDGTQNHGQRAAGLPGAARSGPFIRSLRRRLLAEHLDCSIEDLAAAESRHGGLIAAITALMGPGGSLQPLDCRVDEGLDEMVPDGGLVDPSEPISPDYFVAHYIPKDQHPAGRKRLIANQIVSRFKLAAMKRGELPADERKPFYLYVDESHNQAAENFIELLAEARKYGLGLVLATQHTSQLKGGDGAGSNLLSAIVGNVGTTVIFRLGQEDAAQIGQILYPQFSFQDILGLPNWHGYVRMQFRGQALPPFSFTTIKDNTTFDPALSDANRTHSRKTYGRSAKAVDRRIERRRRAWQDPVSEKKTSR